MARSSTPPPGSLKRPAPSLLPAFEPLSSSPVLPRPAKRLNTGLHENRSRQLPTPVPTSSTGIASSSPPRHGSFVRKSAAERAPLGAVNTVELSDIGEVLMMGRSSNSSHYQLSANRLISRVHVKARYIPAPNSLAHGKIEIVCSGWNGMKLHSQGRTWELRKGDSFTSETEGSDIMIDVQDARVMLRWPKTRGSEGFTNLSDSGWEDSPRRHGRGTSVLASSPLRRPHRVASPVSPTAHLSSSLNLQALFRSRDDGIQIYEDEEEQEPELPAVSMRTDVVDSFELSEDEQEDFHEPSDDCHDPDEENDPIVHSFGPFGANISGRFASITTRSPGVSQSSPIKKTTAKPIQRTPLARALFPSSPPSATKLAVPQPTVREQSPIKEDVSPPTKEDTPCPPAKEAEPESEHTPVSESITNHVINQLAFSRLSSTPLSTIMQHLPTDAKEGLSKESLRKAIENAPAVGIIARQGKDAAGKALESEYYYIPEGDEDEGRRAVMDGMRKPSLRNCRKQHKQYYWKRPKTP